MGEHQAVMEEEFLRTRSTDPVGARACGVLFAPLMSHSATACQEAVGSESMISVMFCLSSPVFSMAIFIFRLGRFATVDNSVLPHCAPVRCLVFVQ